MKSRKVDSNKLSKVLNKRKIIVLFLIMLLLIITISFFIKNNYKNQNLGHNMSNKNIEDIREYILNISSYKAKIEVTVDSNKNTNKYVIEQVYKKDGIAKQKVIQPSNIEGLEIIYEDKTLSLINSKLNITSVYENYEYLVDNFLWLDSFIEDYKADNQAIITEEDGIVIMQAKSKNDNKYVYNKILYINREQGKPIKLVVQDINKKKSVYILYNEVTIN